MTISEKYSETLEKLKKGNVPDAEIDTFLLLEHYYGITRSDLMVHGDRELEGDSKPEAGDSSYLGCVSFDEAVSRRISREPLQYILGQTNFMGLDFYVDENVLVPRSDTEILVEELLRDMHSGSRILDMCTGSGCILISLLNYSYDCEGFGVDISEGALSVALKNAGALIPDKKYTFLQGDLFEAFGEAEYKFDIIVSNPPYIASGEIELLMPEVRDFEPRLALDGTQDGLEFYRRITKHSVNYLVGGGRLAYEIGCDQGEAVKQIMLDNGFTEVEVIKDYAGLDRIVVGIKPSDFTYKVMQNA